MRNNKHIINRQRNLLRHVSDITPGFTRPTENQSETKFRRVTAYIHHTMFLIKKTVYTFDEFLDY